MTDRIAQVYLLRLGDTNYFKVGMTTDVNGRIATLQTATPFDLHLVMAAAHKNAFVVEHDMHEMLKLYRVRNEWFQCDQAEVVRVFEAVSAMATIDEELDDRSLDIETIEAAMFPPPPPAPRPMSPVNHQIEAMLRQGYSYRQIVRELGVSHATIAQINRALRSDLLKSPIFNDEIDDSFMVATSATPVAES